MTDRRKLRDKATSAAKSVAGTLKQGAQNLKSKAETIARDDESGVSISEVEGQYLVIDSDGSAIGPYDDKMKAASKARQLKQEKQRGAQAREGGSERIETQTMDDTSDPGRVQQAATRFTNKVNQTIAGAGGATGGGNSSSQGRTITVEWQDGQNQWFVSGPTAGFGSFETKKAAVTKAEQVYQSRDEYTGLQVETRAGAVQPARSKGTAEGTESMDNQQGGMGLGGLFGGGMDGGGSPSLPFAAGGDSGDESDEQQPSLPFMQGGDGGQPEFPGFGGGGDANGGPSLPGFGGQEGDAEGPTMPGFGGGGGEPDIPNMMDNSPEMGGLPFGGMDEADESDDEQTSQFPWY